MRAKWLTVLTILTVVAAGCTADRAALDSEDTETSSHRSTGDAASDDAPDPTSTTAPSDGAVTASTLATDSSATESSTAGSSTAGSSTTGSSTTASTSTSTTASAAEQGPVNQAEPDLRFDYGEIVGFQRVDGVDWIWFDRHGFGFDQTQGPQHTAEPRAEMATDWHGGENVNPRLRTYPLAPGAVTLQLDPNDLVAACADLDLSWDFIVTDVPGLLEIGAGIVSLTFDGNQQITQVRDQRSC